MTGFEIITIIIGILNVIGTFADLIVALLALKKDKQAK